MNWLVVAKNHEFSEHMGGQLSLERSEHTVYAVLWSQKERHNYKCRGAFSQKTSNTRYVLACGRSKPTVQDLWPESPFSKVQQDYHYVPDCGRQDEYKMSHGWEPFLKPNKDSPCGVLAAGTNPRYVLCWRAFLKQLRTSKVLEEFLPLIHGSAAPSEARHRLRVGSFPVADIPNN